MKHTQDAFTYRQATVADALCIGVLGMQVFLDTYATQGIRSSLALEALQSFSPEVIAETIATPGTSFIVAQANGHLLGFAQLSARTGHPRVAQPEAAELQRLYVQERFTGRGLGKALLEQAERLASREGAPQLWLTVWARNRRALAFYPGQGYRQAGSTAFVFQGESHENHLFVKRLGERRPEPSPA
jgi:ribosomal protein S18 acetylase RimI-like enzyme